MQDSNEQPQFPESGGYTSDEEFLEDFDDDFDEDFEDEFEDEIAEREAGHEGDFTSPPTGDIVPGEEEGGEADGPLEP